MRIDKYLKVARVLKRRATAKSLADNARLRINDRLAKAGSEVRPGDVITVMFGQRELTIRVVQVAEHIRKEEATTLFELIEIKGKEREDGSETEYTTEDHS